MIHYLLPVLLRDYDAVVLLVSYQLVRDCGFPRPLVACEGEDSEEVLLFHHRL